MSLIVLYASFAIAATLANIAVQDIVIHIYDGVGQLPLSIAFGTGAGLVLKYVLDKKYIFRFSARDAAHDGRTFVLYTVMGLATTVIFWGMEFAFDYIFQTVQMRYVGGVIGLGIGYVVKYNLDKKYVFQQVAP